MMSDLVEKIRAAINEHEAAIDAYEAHRATKGQCVNILGDDPARYDEYDSCALHLKTAAAVPYRDMAFGCRQLAAHREILDLHQPRFLAPECATCAPASPDWPCATLLTLAEAYELVEPS